MESDNSNIIIHDLYQSINKNIELSDNILFANLQFKAISLDELELILDVFEKNVGELNLEKKQKKVIYQISVSVFYLTYSDSPNFFIIHKKTSKVEFHLALIIKSNEVENYSRELKKLNQLINTTDKISYFSELEKLNPLASTIQPSEYYHIASRLKESMTYQFQGLTEEKSLFYLSFVYSISALS